MCNLAAFLSSIITVPIVCSISSYISVSSLSVPFVCSVKSYISVSSLSVPFFGEAVKLFVVLKMASLFVWVDMIIVVLTLFSLFSCSLVSLICKSFS